MKGASITGTLAGLAGAIGLFAGSAAASIQWTGGSRDLHAYGFGQNFQQPDDSDTDDWSSSSFADPIDKAVSVDVIGSLSTGKAHASQKSSFGSTISATGLAYGYADSFGLSGYGQGIAHSTFDLEVLIDAPVEVQLTGLVRTSDIHVGSIPSRVNLLARVSITGPGNTVIRSYTVDSHNQQTPFDESVLLPAGTYRIYGTASADNWCTTDPTYGSAQFNLDVTPVPVPASMVLPAVGALVMARRHRSISQVYQENPR